MVWVILIILLAPIWLPLLVGGVIAYYATKESED